MDKNFPPLLVAYVVAAAVVFSASIFVYHFFVKSARNRPPGSEVIVIFLVAYLWPLLSLAVAWLVLYRLPRWAGEALGERLEASHRRRASELAALRAENSYLQEALQKEIQHTE